MRRIEKTIDVDLTALAKEIEGLQSSKTTPQDMQSCERQPLPVNLPRREIHREPKDTARRCDCRMKRIGQDVAEKLDYKPGVFTAERHMRGKWV